MRYSTLVLGIVFCFALFVGCKKAPFKTVPVTVTVLYKGETVEEALVAFKPLTAGPEVRAASSMTDASGKAILMTPPGVKGVIPGKYTVTIMKTPAIGKTKDTASAAPAPKTYDEAMAASQSGQFNMKVDARHQLPVKYASDKTTDLEADVVGPKAMELTFELKD